MHIAACLITKGDGELESLQRCVASFAEVVDSVHIVANHQHKRTQAWCKEKGYDFKYLPWDDDFSEQRNASFAMCPPETDYIYWQDYDDVLVGAKHLREIAQYLSDKDLDCGYLTYWYANKFSGVPSEATFERCHTKQMRERLIRPLKTTWKGFLHETPVRVEGAAYNHANLPYNEVKQPIAVLHLGASDEGENIVSPRHIRNRRILEKSLAIERAKKKVDPRTILYYMKILAEFDSEEDLTKCISLASEYLTLSGWDQERSLAHILAGRCLEKMGFFEQAEQSYIAAIQEYPYLVNPHLRLADVYCTLGKFRLAQFWYNQALAMESEDGKSTGGINNDRENILLSLQVGIRLHTEWKENIKVRIAQELYRKLAIENPHPEILRRKEAMDKLAEMDYACEYADKLTGYLLKEGQEKAVFGVLQSLPLSMKTLPFSIERLKRVSEPKKWGEKDICYVANLGGTLEKWDGDSLKKGIGGSETAVIELSENLVKKGYTVVVYGDPIKETVINGVLYLPLYRLNLKDHFSTFIQWRSCSLAGKVNAKRFFVDLHDVTSANAFTKEQVPAITGFCVKSQAHKKLLLGIPEEKIFVMSNGVRI